MAKKSKPKPKYPIKINFTAKELLDILIDFTVYHVPYLPDSRDDYDCSGVTDSNARNMTLADNHTLDERRRAVIHENLHAYHDTRQEKVPHSQIRDETEIIYKKIYGKS